jgi:acyl carrier protein
MWNEAAEAVKGYIVDEVLEGKEADKLDFQTPLLEWGIIDSLTVAGLVEFAKSRFTIDVPASELTPENLETIGSISAMLERLRATA